MQDHGIFVGHIPSDGVGGAPPLVHYNNFGQNHGDGIRFQQPYTEKDWASL